jgi:hypothetical protein
MALSDAIGSGPDFTIALLDRLREAEIDPAQLFKRRPLFRKPSENEASETQ